MKMCFRYDILTHGFLLSTSSSVILARSSLTSRIILSISSDIRFGASCLVLELVLAFESGLSLSDFDDIEVGEVDCVFLDVVEDIVAGVGWRLSFEGRILKLASRFNRSQLDT